MTAFAATVAALLVGTHQIPADVAATVELASENGQGVITIGHMAGGRRKIVAQVLLPTLADAEALLADRDRIGALIMQGVCAMPFAARPALPMWIIESQIARDAAAMRNRASAAARRAAGNADLPWAA